MGGLYLNFAMTILILSLLWNVETEAIPSQATLVFGLLRYARNDKSLDRHTTFAMTIYTTLVMTKAKMATRHKASRDDKSDCVRDDNSGYKMSA